MKAKFIGFAVAAAGMLALATPAFAATVSSQAVFTNGQTQVYGNAGQTVQTSFQVHVSAGDVLHAIRTKVDSQPTVCTAVGPFEGDQTVTVTTNITLPPNSNTSGYSLVADLFTTDTLPQAQAMTGDLACSSAGSGAHVNLGAYNGGTVVNVLPSNGGTSTGSSTGGVFGFTSFADFVAALKTALNIGSAPAKPAFCASLVAYNGSNAAVAQASLLASPEVAIFHAAGVYAPTGYWGPISISAAAAAANDCK